MAATSPTWQAVVPNRRRRVRHKVHTPAYACFRTQLQSATLDLHEIVDISEDGIAIQCHSPLERERQIHLCLDLAECPEQIYTTARVIWSDDSGRSGSSTVSAELVIRSCSATLSSGCVIDTSSTFRNWCCRSMPRVSRPAAPASRRKQSRQRGDPDRQVLLGHDFVHAPCWSAAPRRWGSASGHRWSGTDHPRISAGSRCRKPSHR